MSVAQDVRPQRIRWTRKEYYRLLKRNMFQGRDVELIEGEIVVMPPQWNRHALGITLSLRSLEQAFGQGYWIRCQASLDLTPFSVPDPDLAVVPGDPRDYATSPNPTAALLLVEVSESTLRYDRRRKGSLYARAGIADYWILNLFHSQLEVYRNPVPDSSQRFGFGYADRTIYSPADFVSPLAAPHASILVADMLP